MTFSCSSALVFMLNQNTQLNSYRQSHENNDPYHHLFSSSYDIELSIQSLAQESLLTPKNLASAYRHPDVKVILQKTASLASVDLSMLNSLTKKMVFFTNVLNFLYAHALMFYFSYEAGVSSPDEEAGEEERVTFPPNMDGLTLSMMKSSQVVQSALMSKVGYHVGQLGLVSCFDLHHCILGHGLAPPILVKDTGLQPRVALVHSDPWLTYAPVSPDPRLFYVIHDGHMTCSIPAPLSVENFVTTLISAEGHYLNANVRVDFGKKSVTIPSALEERRRDFGNIDATCNAMDSLASVSVRSHVHPADMALLRYVQSRLDPNLADILLTMMDAWEAAKSKRVHVVVKQTSVKLGYNFGAVVGGGKATNLSPRESPKVRRTRLPKEQGSKDLSHEHVSSISSSSAALSSEELHFMTTEIFEFVKKQKPLLAGLIALICPSLSPSASRLGPAIKEETERIDGRATPISIPSKGRDAEEPSMSFMKRNFRSVMASPIPFSQTNPLSLNMISSSLPKISHTRSLSLPKIPGISDDRDSTQNFTPWQRQYSSVLAHFPSSSPMKRFLESRLSPFEELVPWWADSFTLKTPFTPSRLSEHSLCLLAAAPQSSKALENACMLVVKHLMESGRVAEAVQFQTSEPAISSCQGHVLSHMVFSCHFVAKYQEMLSVGSQARSSMVDGSNIGRTSQNVIATSFPIPILSQLSDPESAAHLVLSSLHNWPVHECLDMLEYCLYHLPSQSNLISPISKKLERMKVYARILATCDNPFSSQLVRDGQGRADQGHTAPWKTWLELAKDSGTNSNYVLRILLESKGFELSREWYRVHELSAGVTRQIEVDYLFDLLEGENSNSIIAHQVSLWGRGVCVWGGGGGGGEKQKLYHLCGFVFLTMTETGQPA